MCSSVVAALSRSPPLFSSSFLACLSLAGIAFLFLLHRSLARHSSPKLDDDLRCDLDTGTTTTGRASLTVYLIDASNVRGVMGFPSRGRFNASVASWAAAVRPLCAVVIAEDGGAEGVSAGVAGVGATIISRSFAHFSADDVILRDLRWWFSKASLCIVVTSDKLLRSRCRAEARRESLPVSALRLEASDTFVNRLPALREAPSRTVQLPFDDELSLLLAEFVAYLSTHPRPPQTAKQFSAARRAQGRRTSRMPSCPHL